MAKGSWTDTTDKQLLLTVIQLSAPARPKWEQVAALMGEGYTSESVRYAALPSSYAAIENWD